MVMVSLHSNKNPTTTGHRSRSIEGSSVEGDLDYRGLTPEVSEGENISKWPTDLSCDILEKNVAAFCP